MNVILVGYRGSGKSELGRRLAEHLWLDFADTDDEICRRFDGRTIAEIWQVFGEPAFRETEVAVARELCARDGLVIALGGGTVMQPRAREAIAAAENTKRIYLACEADELNRRIQGDTATTVHRPNLTQHGGGVEEIQSLLTERDPIYRELADSVLEVTYTDLDQATDQLLRFHL